MTDLEREERYAIQADSGITVPPAAPATFEPIDDRDPDGVLARAQRREPREPGWAELASLQDRRDALRVYHRLGLAPIVLHGLRGDTCTCGRAGCAAAGKHPALAGWQRDAIDVAAADTMLASNWRMNLGLRMGRQPGGFVLVAIDVDGELALLEPLTSRLGPLPATLTQRTARGWHLIFRVREGVEVKNRVRLAPGVDVRAEGGQIVAAPSRHRSGAAYTWARAMAPAVLP